MYLQKAFLKYFVHYKNVQWNNFFYLTLNSTRSILNYGRMLNYLRNI